MGLLGFLMGLALGLAICAVYHWRLKVQLRSLLRSSPDVAELLPFLSVPSLIRREIAYLNQQIEQRDREIAIWEEMIDGAFFGVLWIDEDNHLLWCNQMAQQWLRIDRWPPSRLRLLLELVRSSALDRLIEQTRQFQTPQSQEWTFYPSLAPLRPNSSADRNNGMPLYLKGYSCPLPQEQVVIFLENQESLRELSRDRDRFFSDLTHELRTPLTALSLLAETLARRLSPPEQRWAEQMGREIARLIQLVQDWLDLAQIKDNPQGSLKIEAIALAPVIQSAWQILQPLADKKAIVFDLPDLGDLQIEGDGARLTQVFLNLLDNSIKHSPPQSAIQLRVEPLTQQIILHLYDQGSGFAPQDLPHVFDRLYRGDGSRARLNSDPDLARSGSGLGLAIAREIIQAHGGNITAQNHPVTGGAWLTLTLPLTQGEELNPNQMPDPTT